MPDEKPTIILDWDGTLFDAHGYWYDMAQAVGELGITRKQWDAAYSDRPDGVLRFERVVDALATSSGADPDEIRQKIDQASRDAVWYLHADVRPFLETVRPYATLILLSFGDEQLQLPKIHYSGLKPCFDEVRIVDHPKPETKGLPVSAVHRAIFVNDSVAETRDMATAFRWAHHLHVNRTGEPVAADFQFPTFPDLRTLATALHPLVNV